MKGKKIGEKICSGNLDIRCEVSMRYVVEGSEPYEEQCL